MRSVASCLHPAHMRGRLACVSFYSTPWERSFLSFFLLVLSLVGAETFCLARKAQGQKRERQKKKRVGGLLSCVWLCLCGVCVCVCDWHPPSGTVRGTVRGTNVFVTCSWDWSSVAPCGDASCCLGSGRCFLLFIFIIHLSPLLPSPLFSSLSSSSPLYLSEEDFFLAEEKIIGVRECIPLGGGGERRRGGKREEEEERRGVCLSFFCAVSICMHVTYSYSCAYV